MSPPAQLDDVDTINPDMIAQALDKVLSSAEFVRSERLRTFLTHLVKKTLAGEADELKGYALGLDVFNKDAGFNPDTDTIVRVHAVRLRAALENYYHTTGAEDVVIIRLPKGGYRPVFQKRSGQEHIETQKPSETTTTSKKLIVGPKLAVMPVENVSEIGKPSDQTVGMTLQIVNDLTRFKWLRVISMQSVYGLQAEGKKDGDLLKSLNVDYVLTISLLNTGRLLVASAQIFRPNNMQTLWSSMVEREFEPKNIKNVLEEITAQIAADTGSTYGAIAEAERARIIANPASMSDGYKCMQSFFSYIAHKTAGKHVAQRQCLEHLVKLYPETSRAWSMLAWIYGDEIRFGYNKDAKNDAVDRSLHAACVAVDLDPSDSFTQAHLAQSLILAGQNNLANEHYQKALGLNPNDAELAASIAWFHACNGDWDEAEKYAQSSIQLGSRYPGWFRAVPYMVYFRNGSYEKALAEVETLVQLKTPLVGIGRIAAYAKLGNRDKALKLLDQLDQEYPGYSDNIGENFKQRHLPKDFSELISDTIVKLRK